MLHKMQWESENFRGGVVIHNHYAGSEACLNRQILNNSVRRKAIGNLCERPRKLIKK